MFKSGTPVYDTVPGRTFNMDSIYWDVESRWGNKYTVVMRDECTLFMCGFHLEKRSDAITEFRKFILKMRADPLRFRILSGPDRAQAAVWLCDLLGRRTIDLEIKETHQHSASHE